MIISKTTKIILLLVITLVTSCSSDDDATAVQTPSVTYTATTLEAIFFQAGSSDAATVNWNGNQGDFSLSSTINGLSINSWTGVINWTSSLPYGTHNLQAIAVNSAGQSAIDITINNPFQGIFTGTKNTIDFFWNWV